MLEELNTQRTPATMAYRVLAAINELYAEFFTQKQEADIFLQRIVDSMAKKQMSGDSIVSAFKEQIEAGEFDDAFLSIGANLSVSLPSIAYSIQAIKAHAANDQENAWIYAAEASYWHGVTISMKAGKDEATSSMARRAADGRHKENRSFKQDAINYYLINHKSFANKDEASSKIAGIIVPVAFSTVRGWLKGVYPE